jgi:hypothetical protein
MPVEVAVALDGPVPGRLVLVEVGVVLDGPVPVAVAVVFGRLVPVAVGVGLSGSLETVAGKLSRPETVAPCDSFSLVS